MKRRSAGRARAAVVALGLLLGGAAAAAPPRAQPLRRSDLIGAWRLVRIEYSGPQGPAPDPFYAAGSTGIIVYDPGGWMSVQIAGPGRRAWPAASARSAATAAQRDAGLKAAAFDSYYAYFGTWSLDAARAQVVHHVQSSLIPAEDGVTYSQEVSVANGCMTFTNRGGARGAQSVRRKVWARIGAHARCGS